MTSRRAQVRTLLSSMPLDLDALGGSGGSNHDSTGARDAIVSRTESYLAAVDVWATRGNQKALSRVGPGVVAVCAWLAIKNLGSASSSAMTAFQKKSGLPPAQFEFSAQQLSAGIKSVRSASSMSSPASSAPSTPRHRDRAGAGVSTSNASTLAAASASAQDRTPEALAKRARDVMSGAAFGFSFPSSSSAHGAPSVSSACSTPKTPSGRIVKQTSQASSSRDASLSPSTSRTTLRAPEQQQQQHASAMPHTPSRRSRLREQADLSSSATNGDRTRSQIGQIEDEDEDDEEGDEDDEDEEANEGLDSDEEEALQREWTQRREAEEARQDQAGKRRRNVYDFARTFDEGDEEVFARLDGDVRARKRLKWVQLALERMIQERKNAGDEVEEPDSDDILTTVSIKL